MGTSIYSPIPDELSFLRKIPISGTWAMLVGNSYAHRRNALPQFCEKYNLRRMDIIYVYNEQMSTNLIDRIFNKVTKPYINRKRKFEDIKKLHHLFTEEGIEKEVKQIINEEERFQMSSPMIYQ